MEIEKAKMMSMDVTQKNIAKIREIFPNAITEIVDNGKEKFAIDFEILKQELSDSLVSEKQERYQMTWPNKRNAILLANTKTTKTLRPLMEKSVNFDKTKNIYIEGDNLDSLKVIREMYLGKLDCIYIDPPYNTGNDFIYPDNFDISENEYLSISGEVDDLNNKMVANPTSNGRFHTDWLNMIYPRIKIAKDLLKDDGVIFISIDENEITNMKKICDEIFGENKLIGTFKWNRVAKAPSLSNSIRTKYEYVLAYCKSVSPKLFGKESYNKQGPLWHLPNKRALLRFPAKSIRVKQSFNKGDYGGSYQVELLDDLVEKNGLNENEIRVMACSAWGQQRILEYVRAGNTFEIKNNPATFYTDLSSEGNFIPPSDLISFEECGVKRNTDANEEMKSLGIPFDYSKPSSLIKYLIKMVCYERKNALVMDFFSGSATTAQACFELNDEMNQGINFILIQLPEEINQDDKAYSCGYQNICELGQDRIKKCTKLLKNKGNDTGFRVLKLDSSNMTDVFYNPKDMVQNLLEASVDNVKSDRSSLDLLFQVMLECGALLSSKIEEKKINGKTIYCVSDNYIIACYDDNLDEETLKEIAKMQPIYASFKDSSFNSDAANINAEQIFKTYSPNTEKIKVI